MKYLKLFLIAIVALAVTSCKDDAKWNTKGDVYVQMTRTEFGTKEGRRLARVPFSVVGDANGNIKVNFSVTEAATNGAKEDIHYYITSKTVVINPEDKEGYFEFTIVNDTVQNDPRVFILTIESAEGALVGNPSQCIVSIGDNDDDPYDRLGGVYTMSYLDDEEVEGSLQVSIEPYMEDEPQYHRVLPMVGSFVSGDADMSLRYITSSQDQGIAVGIIGGSVLLKNNDFGNVTVGGESVRLGQCDVITAFMNSQGLTESGLLEGRWNEDFSEVVFDGTLYLGIRTTQDNDGYFGANALVTYMSSWHNIKLTRLREID